MVSDIGIEEVNYYFITDEGSEVSIQEQVEAAVDAGVKMIQLRLKDASDGVFFDIAKRLKNICEGKAVFIVNDRVDVAMAVDADGVHIGQDDIPPEVVRELIGEDKILGLSTHDEEQAEDAAPKADYIGIGPIHKTTTKEDPDEELGVERAVKICKNIDVPTTAIGGITDEDLPELVPPFEMICAVSDVTREGGGKEEMEERVRYYEETIKRSKEEAKHD
ncbi:MAG: thiamine phosphate synthase [Thermoplasmatota archaeon]